MGCCEIDRGFLKTIPFYLKVAELVICIIVWICVGSVSGFRTEGGGGFINFCSTISFIMTIILFFLYLFGKIQKLPGPWVLIEVISIMVSALLYLISMIVAIVYSTTIHGVIATAVFCTFDVIIYIIELVLRFNIMRGHGFHFTAEMKGGNTTNNTNTETSNNPSGPYIIGA